MKAWEIVQEAKHRLGSSLAALKADKDTDTSLYQPVKDDLNYRLLKLQEIETFLFKLSI